MTRLPEREPVQCRRPVFCRWRGQLCDIPRLEALDLTRTFGLGAREPDLVDVAFLATAVSLGGDQQGHTTPDVRVAGVLAPTQTASSQCVWEALLWCGSTWYARPFPLQGAVQATAAVRIRPIGSR